MRILHTADWQIGMRAAHVGKAGPSVRDARLASARRVVEIANERHVDALVLAGDTFEDSDVPRDLVQKVADILGESVAPVLVLPANHDPLVPGGVWEHPAWKDKDPRVRILRSTEPFQIGGALFLACPLLSRTSPEDPTDALQSTGASRDQIRIGIAHGSLRGAGAPDDQIADDFPIKREVVRRAALDYLALGHWHTPSIHEVDGVERIAYCGSHEPTKFGETSEKGASGQCLVVTIEAPGGPPVLESLNTRTLEWRSEKLVVSSVGDLTELRSRLDREPADSRERTLLDLVLTGVISPADATALDDLLVLARERFLYARIRSDALTLRPDGEGWIDQLPAGVPRAVARRLADLADSPNSSSTARDALDLLYRIHAEVAR